MSIGSDEEELRPPVREPAPPPRAKRPMDRGGDRGGACLLRLLVLPPATRLVGEEAMDGDGRGEAEAVEDCCCSEDMEVEASREDRLREPCRLA